MMDLRHDPESDQAYFHQQENTNSPKETTAQLDTTW